MQKIISISENRNDCSCLYITYGDSEGLIIFTGKFLKVYIEDCEISILVQIIHCMNYAIGKQMHSHIIYQPPTRGIIDAYEINLLWGSRKLLFFIITVPRKYVCLRYPEMLQVHTVYGTNGEGETALASVDGNNIVLDAAITYIPDAQRLVFKIIFE